MTFLIINDNCEIEYKEGNPRTDAECEVEYEATMSRLKELNVTASWPATLEKAHCLDGIFVKQF